MQPIIRNNITQYKLFTINHKKKDVLLRFKRFKHIVTIYLNQIKYSHTKILKTIL